MKFKGFTLIELMIVIAILGILASIAVPAFVNYEKRNNPEYADIRELKEDCKALDIDFPSSSFAALVEAKGSRRMHLLKQWKIKCKVEIEEETFPENSSENWQ